MPTATWNGAVIASAPDDQVHIVENKVYFPLSAVDPQYLLPSATTSHCGWKGAASYFTLAVAGATNPDAAWYYKAPLDAASQIRDHVAFWKGVRVQR